MEKGLLKATTVHQELRVLRRMLNVAVERNSCLRIHVQASSFRQEWKDSFGRIMSLGLSSRRSSSARAGYLRNVIRIITETGLRSTRAHSE